MSFTRKDYVANAMSEMEIARRTLAARRAAHSENDHYFNIVKFFEGPFLAFSNYRPIERIPFDAPLGGRPAFVRHNPVRFSVDREYWQLALLGDPEARDVIAHELGHIDLHGYIVAGNAYQQSFSSEPGRHVTFVDLTRSAEWQADTYRDYLLVPDRIAISLDSAREIAEKCSVPIALAQRRFGATRQYIRKQAEAQCNGYVGDSCPECSNFTMVRNGTCLKCDTCGSTTGCS